MKLLEVTQLTKCFGGLRALDNVDFQVESGSLVGIIGPNGAGKSTLFKLLSGAMRPTRGSITFLGEDITGIKAHAVAEKGIVRTFQEVKLFMHLSVLENVRIGCHIPVDVGVFQDIFSVPSARRREEKVKELVEKIIGLVGLNKVREELAGNLPHGYQRSLGVAIALAAEPKLLCLDEPVTGMNVEETQFMMGIIEKIREQGITILLVEHDMRVVMGICDRVNVLNFGKKIAEGTPEEIQSNSDVIEAYLGRPEEYAT